MNDISEVRVIGIDIWIVVFVVLGLVATMLGIVRFRR
jgi:hypothetical protein